MDAKNHFCKQPWVKGCLYPPLEGVNLINAMIRFGAGGGHLPPLY